MNYKKYPHDKFIGEWAWSSDHFWSKIVKSENNACWTWLGSNSPYGPLFGASKLDKDNKYKKQMTQARRILFAETQGRALNQRESVFHSCHNKNCMNPDHLTLELQRRPQEELKKPGPKPRDKPEKVRYPKSKTKIHKDIERLNNLQIPVEAN